MDVNLMSCPFCGSNEVDPSFVRGYEYGDLSQPIIAAGCMECGASGKSVNVPDHSTGYKEAADAWNKRQPSDLEIVQKALDKTNSVMNLNSDGCAEVMEFDDWGVGKHLFNGNIQSLLTWAKQTIGE